MKSYCDLVHFRYESYKVSCEPHIPFDIFPKKCNITQFIYFWKPALHVSGGISTHHQEHIRLYLQYLVLVKRYCYLPLLWESWNWFECGVGIVPICFGAAALLPHQNRSVQNVTENGVGKIKKGRMEIGIEETKGIVLIVVDNKGQKKTCN